VGGAFFNTFSTFLMESVETHADETPRYDKMVRGIMATKFAWNRGESVTEGKHTSYLRTKLLGLPSE
jgi:hypothetical protein